MAPSGPRVALFVEGSTQTMRRGVPPLERIWSTLLAGALGLERFEVIVPISKKHLVAMDPDNPPMSGCGEPLDLFIERHRVDRDTRDARFEAAVVAWDLVPAWNPDGEFCRWKESLNLYRFLKDSRALPQVWRARAGDRFAELMHRRTPSARLAPPTLEQGSVIALCMEPMFEGLLTMNETALLRALDLAGRQRPSGWPTNGWGESACRHPDRDLLIPAVASLRRLRPKHSTLRRIGGDFRTRKAEWGAWFLSSLLEDDSMRERVLEHPICRRLKECLSLE
jgi:hypothetical protein